MNIKTAASAFFGAILLVALNQSAFAVQPGNVNNLVGTWVNVNPSTRGTVKVVISNSLATGFQVHTYGACTPTPCDHGAIPASRFSKDVTSVVAQGLSAQYDFGFSKVLVTGQRIYNIDGGNFLELETRTTFAKGDTRNDYIRTEIFRKP